MLVVGQNFGVFVAFFIDDHYTFSGDGSDKFKESL